MAIYLVQFGNTTKLVDARTKAAAINHVVKGIVTAQALTAAEVAHHMKGGADFETVASEEGKVVETAGNAARDSGD